MWSHRKANCALPTYFSRSGDCQSFQARWSTKRKATHSPRTSCCWYSFWVWSWQWPACITWDQIWWASAQKKSRLMLFWGDRRSIQSKPMSLDLSSMVLFRNSAIYRVSMTVLTVYLGMVRHNKFAKTGVAAGCLRQRNQTCGLVVSWRWSSVWMMAPGQLMCHIVIFL